MSLNAFIAVHDMLGHPVLERHPRAMAVLIVLANAADDEGYEWCTVETLAKRARMPRSTFLRLLDELKAASVVANVLARNQPHWLRQRISGSRTAVRKVPTIGTEEVPTIGTEEVPTIGTEEVPTIGTRQANLRRGLVRGKSPDHRDGRSPDGRDADPACDPACISEPLVLSTGDHQIDTSTQRAHVGGAGGATGGEQVEGKPTDPAPAHLPKPATTKRAPKSQPSFLLDVVEALLPGVVALHGRTFGSPPTGRQTQGYRDRIASCVQHHEKGEQAVRARAAGLDAVLRWWELPHRDTVPRGAPACWWSSPTPRALLPVHADQLDSLIGHARTGLEQAERAKSMNTNRNSGSTGVYLQPDHYVDATGMNNAETWKTDLRGIGPLPGEEDDHGRVSR